MLFLTYLRFELRRDFLHLVDFLKVSKVSSNVLSSGAQNSRTLRKHFRIIFSLIIIKVKKQHCNLQYTFGIVYIWKWTTNIWKTKLMFCFKMNVIVLISSYVWYIILTDSDCLSELPMLVSFRLYAYSFINSVFLLSLFVWLICFFIYM